MAVQSHPSPPNDKLGRSSTNGERTPPHNLDAEVSVLGSMLLSRDAIADVSELVGPADFYRGAHRTLFESARGLYDRGEPVDLVTLADELERQGMLDDVGGPTVVAELLDRVPTAANAIYYARIVADHAQRRRLVEAGTQIARLGYDTGERVEESVDRAESLIYQVGQRRHSGEFVTMKELVTASWDLLERLSEQGSAVTGLATGFVDFDELTAGLQPQNLVVLAARPAMGKSTLVTNMAAHVAVELREPAIMFSLEMSQMELVQRILSSEARVNSDKLRTGRLDERDWPKLSQAMGRLAEAPLYIDDTPGINLMEIRSKCRRLAQRKGLSLVIVDYLQLMQAHRRNENRVQEVSELSRGLKMLAKELDVPVIALSQLSRKPEERSDRRPQLADLRESGCVTGDTQIALASGAVQSISALVGTQPEVATSGACGFRSARASRVWCTGTKQVFRVTTASGLGVRATASHPLLTAQGWRPLGLLAPGGHIAVPPSERPSPGWRPPSWEADPAGSQGSGQVLDLAPTDVGWDRISSIEPCGVEPVFDMTVPRTHNFVGDGIVLHNSIEQDADIVAFIYRDEVYDPDSDAKGEAELIVAKHRNGALRTVRLSFIGHHSRFVNMARGPIPGRNGPPRPPPGPL